jgi:hypothetical protein
MRRHTAISHDLERPSRTAGLRAPVRGAAVLQLLRRNPRVSLDCYLERSISWRHRIAEVGHGAPQRTVMATTPAPQLQRHSSILSRRRPGNLDITRDPGRCTRHRPGWFVGHRHPIDIRQEQPAA